MKTSLVIALLCASVSLPSVVKSATEPPAQNTPAPSTLTWVGAGKDANWSTAENWLPAQAPTATDNVVLDGTSDKVSVWDQEFTIQSLTVKPTYKGMLKVRKGGAIEGNVVLNGKIEMARNSHYALPMRGTLVDLSGVETWCAGDRFLSPLDLSGASDDLVQTFIPPTRPIDLGDVRFTEKGTTKLAGDLINCHGVEITGDKTVDLQGHSISTQRFYGSGQMKNLGGSTLRVTGWAAWAPYGIGVSKTRPTQPRGGKIDLVSDKPWKIIVDFKDLQKWSDATKRPPFTITKSSIANLDSSGGEEIIAKGCQDMGGNKNVKFVE